MKSSELRIGNFITIDNKKWHPKAKNEILTVVIINNDSASMNYLDDSKNIVEPAFSQLEEYLSPIQLTEEWLIKMGFFVNGDKFYKGEIGLYLDGNIWWCDEIISENIISVHQLQNLYFALTGKELEIKEQSKR